MNQGPPHPFPCPIPRNPQQAMRLVAIQALDRVVEAALGVLLGMRRQGVVDPRRPTFFLERGKDPLLVRRGKTKLFDQLPGDS